MEKIREQLVQKKFMNQFKILFLVNKTGTERINISGSVKLRIVKLVDTILSDKNLTVRLIFILCYENKYYQKWK